MRSYENSGYNPYNDNDRSQTRGSARNYYSNDYDITNRNRSGYGSRRSDLGSGTDAYASSGYGNTSSYGRSAGTSNYGSSGYSSDYDRDRTYRGDRDTWDRTKDEVKSWFGDDDAERRRRRDEMRDRDHWGNSSYGSSNYGSTSGYGSYNRPSSSYSSGSNYSGSYGSGTSNYGSGSTGYGTGTYGSGTYGTGYSSRNYGSGSSYGSSSWDRDRDRDRYSSNWDKDHDHERGFFDRAGDEVKSWFGDEEAERRRRMDEMHDRDRDRDINTGNRYGSTTNYTNTYSGPPYSYGSSSRRDYEW